MAIWSKCSLTDVGRALIVDCQANDKTLTFTNCVTSSHNYFNDDIELLTDLENKEQTTSISEKYVENNDTVKVVANVENTNLLTSYQLYTYGIYANSGGNDVLLLVGATDTPDQVPTITDAPWQAVINSYITISNAPNITIQVNPAANATIYYVDSKFQEIIGMVDENNTASTIPKRTSNKYIKASTPIGENNECVVNKGFLNTTITVQVPTSGWSGPTNNLYTKTINVDNMYASYTGSRACDYERLTTDSLATLEAKADAFSLIKNIVSNNGSITIYAESVPTTTIKLIFYGV